MLLIIPPSCSGSPQLIAKTAEALGWKIFNDGWRVPDNLRQQPGAVYGEQYFCEAIAEQMGWKLLKNPIDWIAKLPEEYIHRKVSFMKLEEARKISEERFFKPADNPTFISRIYSSGLELPINPIFNDDPVIVSDVMKFTSEYRCLVKDRQVIAACCYWLKKAGMEKAEINEQRNYENNIEVVIEFVNKLVSDIRVDMAPAVVIDVGRFKKDTYTVIGTKPVWRAAAYGCEQVAFLDAIQSACVSEN